MNTVAVVLCNYNHARYLPDSLGHIFGQTRPADQVIVIDDGSSDRSWEIIESFARANSTLQAYANGRNLGLGASIEKALDLVRCDYLVWTAADDRLLPPFLERNMAVLARHPQAGLSFSEVVSLEGDSGKIDHFAINPSVCHIFNLADLPEYVPPERLRRRMKRGYLPVASNTAVIRAAALEAIGRFPSALRWFADSFVCTALAMRHGACVLAEPLALIRASDTSYSRGMYHVPRQTEVLDALLDVLQQPQFRDVRSFLRECPSNLTVYDPILMRVLARRPRDWDLFATYAGWKLVDRARHSRLGQVGGRIARSRTSV
jgi:glycosyltransferase involved in cell wall biosynthesis